MRYLGLTALLALAHCGPAPRPPDLPPGGCEIEARPVYVLGQVERPGMITPARGVTLYQAIERMGGLTSIAAHRAVRITRCGRSVQFAAPTRAGDPADVALLPGDTILALARDEGE